MKVSHLISINVVSALLAFTFSSQVASAQQYTKITRLGTSQAVCSGGVETAAQLQQFFANNPSKIRDIIADSGWTGSADALMAAVANGEMIERAYPVGTRLLWSGANKNGAYVAKRYREWAGAKSFEGFQIDLRSDCQVHHIAIPKACCNVSLISIEADTSASCASPTGAALVAPASDARGAGSNAIGAGSDARGAGASAIAAGSGADTRATGSAAKASDSLALVPFIGAFVGTETRPRLETAWQMDMRDSSGVIGIRAGLLKALSAKTSLLGQVSYLERQGVNGGNVYPEENFSVDIGVEHKLSHRAFIGAGIGAWDVDDSDFRDTSLYGIVGGDIAATNFQWFLEGRVFDSNSLNHDSISDNRMFSAGLRYLIK